MLMYFWQEWLEYMCKKCGWTHKESPLIWRELVHQGGKELFLGGFNDFLEHCQVIVEKKKSSYFYWLVKVNLSCWQIVGKLQMLAKYISHCKSNCVVINILFNWMNHSQLASSLILPCVAIAIKLRLCDKLQNRKSFKKLFQTVHLN